MGEQTKFVLPESEVPERWYNIAADLPRAAPPPLNPATHEPIGPEALAPLFPMELIKQEVSQERYIDVPDEVREVYKLWRPTPLVRARRLEKALDTPAHIYFKYEGASPVGSHKPNTAVAQAYYNKQEGVKRITTETGAGQWGCALAMACNFFGIDLKVYMVGVSFEQKKGQSPLNDRKLTRPLLDHLGCHIRPEREGRVEPFPSDMLVTFLSGTFMM